MKPVFENSGICEKLIKETFHFPPFIMMENAAAALEQKVLEVWDNESFDSVIIIAGKGNNGADGLALARRLFWKIPVQVFCPEIPKTEEGLVQAEMIKKIKVPFISERKIFSSIKTGTFIIVDCLFGTGFHGNLSEKETRLIDELNKAKGYKIACDIPSALYFKADWTVTMGTYKSVLYSDKAKDKTGKISVCELGISETLFEKKNKTDVFLVEEQDIKLPERKSCDTHKGKFGHACIISGEKSGASILSAEAALNFGSGLVTLLKGKNSNLSQFKVSPSLMISENLPKNITAIQAGSGLGTKKESFEILSILKDWFSKTENPACVLDADLFNYLELKALLSELNTKQNARIVLTPHAKELCNLVKLCGIKIEGTDDNISPSEILEHRFLIGKIFTKKFPNTVLVMKGANTFIAEKGNIFIFDKGTQSLSKGGSGDILAGMITSLLSQGYTAKDAAITAVYRHGTCASDYGKTAYNLTPEKLISIL